MVYLLVILFIISFTTILVWGRKFLAWFLSPGLNFIFKLILLPILLPYFFFKIISSPIQVGLLLPNYYRQNVFKGIFATFMMIVAGIIIYVTLIIVITGIFFNFLKKYYY